MKMAGFFVAQLEEFMVFYRKSYLSYRETKNPKKTKKIIPNDGEISNDALQIDYELQHD